MCFSLFTMLLIWVLSLGSFSVVSFYAFKLFFLGLLGGRDIGLGGVSSGGVRGGVRRLASGVCHRNIRGKGRRTRQLVDDTHSRTTGVMRSTHGRTRSVLTMTQGSTGRATRGARSRVGLFTKRTMGTLGARVTALLAGRMIDRDIGKFITSGRCLGGFVISLTTR